MRTGCVIFNTSCGRSQGAIPTGVGWISARGPQACGCRGNTRRDEADGRGEETGRCMPVPAPLRLTLQSEFISSTYSVSASFCFMLQNDFQHNFTCHSTSMIRPLVTSINPNITRFSLHKIPVICADQLPKQSLLWVSASIVVLIYP
jgi:hypothetical protein